MGLATKEGLWQQGHQGEALTNTARGQRRGYSKHRAARRSKSKEKQSTGGLKQGGTLQEDEAQEQRERQMNSVGESTEGPPGEASLS